MIRFVPLVFVTVALLYGCGKKETPQMKSAAPDQEMMKPDPAAFVDTKFLNEQNAKREVVRHQLDSLRALPVIQRGLISSLINRRKGELMTLKKNLRNSQYLTPVEKDSLIAPLENESIELSGDLIAVAK